jgi:hypothetical protein
MAGLSPKTREIFKKKLAAVVISKEWLSSLKAVDSALAKHVVEDFSRMLTLIASDKRALSQAYDSAEDQLMMWYEVGKKLPLELRDTYLEVHKTLYATLRLAATFTPV